MSEDQNKPKPLSEHKPGGEVTGDVSTSSGFKVTKPGDWKVSQSSSKTAKRQFTATTWQEDDGWIAQCLEVDIASQGETEQKALDNLKEALELHFEPPTATILPNIHTLEIDAIA